MLAELEKKKLLVVGAGGIGCELLKNLVLTGFKKIHVIDLDTIDVSNLNRQFLFRREHVGKSKAEVATEAVRSLRKDAEISFDHASIFDSKFGLSFFQDFDFVMNALDNKQARTHVNRMCLAARIPLVESGSAGYLGQVTTILRGVSECFECVPKPNQQKTFPGCTIRNTPSEHIHCTVWAKHLFNQLFGEVDIDDDVSPDMNDEENKPDGQEEEKADGEKEPAPENTRIWAEEVNYDPERLFKKLFFDDIKYLLRMDKLWKERKRPTPLQLDSLHAASAETNGSVDADIKQVWSPAECGRVFADCVIKLRERKAGLPEGSILAWDKDDDEAMHFVAACANIRAHIFGINMKTAFEIKSMAGNIIPAIATTNAIVAGMMVNEAIKISTGRLSDLRNVFINRLPNPSGKILMDEALSKPNPDCLACSDKHECFIRVNVNEMTLKALKDKVLRGALNFVAPDVEESGRVLINSEEEEDEIQLKRLAEMKIVDGATLQCEDFTTDLKIVIYIQSSDKLKGDDFEVVDNRQKAGEESPTKQGKRISEVANGEQPDSKRLRAAVEA